MITEAAQKNLIRIAAAAGVTEADALNMAKLVAAKIEAHGYADAFKQGGDMATEIMQAAALAVVRDSREVVRRYYSEPEFRSDMIARVQAAAQ